LSLLQKPKANKWVAAIVGLSGPQVLARWSAPCEWSRETLPWATTGAGHPAKTIASAGSQEGQTV